MRNPGTAMTTALPSSLPATNVSLGDHTSNVSCSNILATQHQNVIVPTVYSIIFLLGFMGNSLVVFVLCQRGARSTVANIYMLNLALSDMFFLASLPFWAVYYYFDYNWPFGTLLCKLCGSLLSLNVYASIFFITCMSVDRYLAIIYPFQAQRRRNLCGARSVACVVWVVAAIASIPTAVFRDTHHLEELGVTACVMHYPQPRWLVGLAMTKNTLGFLLPFAIIASCYCAIARHLLETSALDRSSSNLDHVLRMVVAVVLAFFICWFPFHVLTFLNALTTLRVLRACWLEEAISAALPFSLCLGFANSAINPFLYCFVGNHFRERLSRLHDSMLPSLAQKRGSVSTRLSSFSRKLSDLKDLRPAETVEQLKML
ncbi:type-2 angiotensin II receptor isoform X2 [Scleropages formosus]|nr:type-2 angiotensin II receptor-like isoform X2 [Scleropages formosus]XP_018583996.1 type-2 angiotensin II receptor-like isoform X2 [Scleropages formosus]